MNTSTLKILNRLEKVKNLEKVKDKFFVFDCETFSRDARPEGFALCCLYGNDTRKFFRNIQDFKDEIFNGEYEGKYIFSHFSEFDLNVIFGNIKTELDNEAIFNGSTFIMAKAEGVIFCDSLNIYKTSVKKIGEVMGIEKLEMDERFGKGVVFETTDQDIIYCMRDCEIVWKALEKIFLEVQSVRPTLASLSMIYFRRFFMKHHIAYNELTRKFFDSYTGGRVEAYRIGTVHSSKYDFNSMYPDVMSKAVFPNPKYIQVSSSKTVEGLLHDMKYYEGQATLKVKHKDVHFGFLPVKRDGKLKFPVGIFSGCWCFPEIRYALKMGIIEILEVGEILISRRMETPFREFAVTLYNSRLKVTGIEKVVKKLLMNTLYGKFAQREKHRDIYFEYVPFDIITKLKELKVPYELKMFNQHRQDCYLIIFSPIKVDRLHPGFRLHYATGEVIEINEFSIYTKKELRNWESKPKIHTIPVFSSYITSIARVNLLKQIQKLKYLGVTYVDTDSVAVQRIPRIKDSMKLGKLKREEEMIREIFGNKNYVQELDGKLERKIKGVPKKALELEPNKYQIEYLIKTKKAIRHGKKAGVWETGTKTLTNTYDKRKIMKDGKTKPLKYKL